MRVVISIDGWCGPVGVGCLWPLDEICESSPKFVMQEQSAWTENVTEIWTEKKHGQKRKWGRLPKHGQKKDWQTRSKHGQKRSVDRTTETRTEKKHGQKKWQTRPKHGHNRSTDRKSEKTRPKTWTEKAEKVRNTTETRTENVANTTEIWTENLTITICCERNWVVSFLLKEQNKQTNKTQKDSGEKVSMLSFLCCLRCLQPPPCCCVHRWLAEDSIPEPLRECMHILRSRSLRPLDRFEVSFCQVAGKSGERGSRYRLNMSMYGFEALYFNVDGGYLEAIVRGYRAGLLTAADYNNLCQCESLDDVKMHLAATDYGPYLANGE